MDRRKMIGTTTALLGVALTGCGMSSQKKTNEVSTSTNNNQKQDKMTKYSKKYTNKDFYTDGKFNQDVAMKAMKDMFEFYDVPFTEFMEKNMWVADFGLGDFENTGMGGIFWINDKEHGYFAHEIYLLPGQMIPEHCHLPTDMPAKHEAWMVNKGWAYNFTEIGEGPATPNAPEIPKAHGPVTSKYFTIQKLGEIAVLKKLESYHFLKAGPEGVIITEWASYHDNAGLRFTNKNAQL